MEADEHEQGDVLSASITTTDQSTTEIDDATASLSKLQTDNKTVSRPPTKLQLTTHDKTSSHYLGVSWREDENILCSTGSDSIEVRSGTDLQLIKRINITGGVISAYSVGDQLITKVRKDGTHSTYIGTESNPQHTLLHQYEGCSSQLSVSDSMIADIDGASKQLMIYTITGNHLYNIDICDVSCPIGVHILPAGDSVLVSDWGDEGEVRKYKLQAGEHHQPVW